MHPLLILGGLACLLLVDLLACTLRRVPLAGLPLLTVYSVPVSLVGGGVSWWVFALTAAGFLGLLFLQESDQVARWGRPLGQDPAWPTRAASGVRTGAVRTSAGAIGGARRRSRSCSRCSSRRSTCTCSTWAGVPAAAPTSRSATR